MDQALTLEKKRYSQQRRQRYRLANRDKIKARQKRCCLANRDKIKAQQKLYYLANRYKRIEYSKTRDRLNPDRKMASRLKRVYGISLDYYNEMLHRQGSLCFVCKGTETKKRSLPHNR